MSVVFMQNDPDFVESFLWSEDMGMVKNVLLSLQGEVDFYGSEDKPEEYCLAYQTEDHNRIYEILAVTFDSVVVMNNEETVSDNFILNCQEYKSAE